jgi:hypothetical protein
VCAICFTIARETAGAARTRSSLRSLKSEAPRIPANLGRHAPRDRYACLEVVIANL